MLPSATPTARNAERSEQSHASVGWQIQLRRTIGCGASDPLWAATPRRLKTIARIRIIGVPQANDPMALRKVTFYDKDGTAIVPVDEDGQAKPCVMGVRWVNPDTFETIRAIGGKRTGPKNEVLQEIPPTLDLSAFAIENLGKKPRTFGK
jgi:hypothetical protein